MTLAANHIIEINALHRNFGKETALEDINIQIRRGQAVGIIRENGAGKTNIYWVCLNLPHLTLTGSKLLTDLRKYGGSLKQIY